MKPMMIICPDGVKQWTATVKQDPNGAPQKTAAKHVGGTITVECLIPHENAVKNFQKWAAPLNGDMLNNFFWALQIETKESLCSFSS